MKNRSVQQILMPPPPHMVGDGFRVHNFFPGTDEKLQYRMNPFFLLDYNALMEFSPRENPRGVGVHPHRGFETVTIAYKGRVAHHDSAGNSGVIGEGDIQWMTAASGVLHKEYHEAEYSRKGGPFQMVQLWINLPAKDKMSPPKYQAIVNGAIPRYDLPEKRGEVEVIAGSFKGIKGAASTFTPIEMYNVRLQEKAELTIDLPEDYNTGILVVEGSVRINDAEVVPTDRFVLMANDGVRFRLQAESDCLLLVLSGKPIDEPVVAYGPFVMNTKAEILQAYNDVNAGKFGHLED